MNMDARLLKKKLWKNFVKNLQNFLQNTSLQGLKYICDTNLCLWARIYFGIIFLVVSSIAMQLAINVYHRWESNPVIIGMSSRTTSIRDVPFPAITFCNMNQLRYSKVAHFQNGTLDFAMRQKICFQKTNYSSYETLQLRSGSDTFMNYILRNAQSCESMIIMCKFGPQKIPCDQLFRTILLDEGMCCVFNLLHPSYLYRSDALIPEYMLTKAFADVAVDWNPITGYAKNLPKYYFPRKNLGAGTSLGMQILLNGNINDYFCSSTNGPGFKVLLYNPIDQPHIKETGLPVKFGHQSNFGIVTKSFVAERNIRSVDRYHRQCIFSDEQPMLFFRYYTRRNCEAECDSLYMLRNCDCIPFELPLVYSNATYCHVKHFGCVVRAESQIFDCESIACKKQCLPSCHEISYFPKLYATPFAERQQLAQNIIFKNFTKEFIRDNLALVNFFHKDNYFRSNIKTSYTGPTEYMSLTGGIMSLMIGFSVISLAEILYYVFLHPVFNYLRQRKARTQKIIPVIPRNSSATIFDSSVIPNFKLSRRPLH